MPNSIVFSNPGASIIRWGDGVAAPYLTLSGIAPSTLVGVAVTGTVTNTGSAAGQWSVASAPADVLVSPSSGTLAPNAFAAFTLTALAAGVKTITLSSSTPGATISGSPASLTATSPAPAPTPTPPPPPAPTGNITQYLTSDGGSATYSGNFSGPTRDKWHNRLGFAWKRTNTLGNWLDASQVEEGSTAYATSSPITAVNQTVNLSATALVTRWMSNGLNRGAYLRIDSGSAFPVAFYGRTDATSSNRPTLTVVTNTGTFILTAAANAYWYNSSFTGTGSAAEWRLSRSAAPAILRFDLSTVTGTVTGATISVKVKSFPSGGSTGQIVGLYECDPPTIVVPENPIAPVLGLRSGYANFNAWKASGHANLIQADDFELGGPFDGGFTPAATRTLNTATNTTYARGEISAGANGSANSRLEVSAGTGTRGTPNVIRDEVYGQYWLYLENDFGTTQDDAIKIPAMGVQFGYWVSTGGSTGYWQQTTGNGGSPGTGLKVDNGGGSNYEYQGHSVRFLTGTRPTALDDDPYTGWFGLGIYPYNLDQGGPFPAGEPFPYVAIRPLQQYCVDIRVKQNTMSGAQDGLGNYTTAIADGVYQVWLNGYQVYSKTNYRWRKHAEFGVQGVWIDVYHGGVTTAPQAMHYQLDQVSLATAYVGPPASTLPTWVPAAGRVATLTIANGKLTNSFASQVASHYTAFDSVKIVNDYSGSVLNPYLGTYGAVVFEGGGHSATNDNSVMVLDLGATAATFRRVVTGSNLFPSNTSRNDRESSNTLFDHTWGEHFVDGQPIGRHSYGDQVVIGPEYGGASYGSFMRFCLQSASYTGSIIGEVPHKVAFTAATGSMAWSRGGNAGVVAFDTTNVYTNAACWAEHVPSQNRVYKHVHASSIVRWFDLTTSSFVTGTGTGLTNFGTTSSGGMMFHVPSRNLMIFCDNNAGALRIRTMDTTVADPSWDNTARTLSTPVAVNSSWSAACWCEDNSRIIVGNINGDANAVFEIQIPATLTNTWTATRKPFTGGDTINWAPDTTYKKWTYNPRTRSIVYLPYASNAGTDTVYIYRPENT